MEKQFKTIEEQIEILKERGCIISDVSFARETLSKINYYRLTAYLLPFKDKGSKEERYLPKTIFEKIVAYMNLTENSALFCCKLSTVLK